MFMILRTYHYISQECWPQCFCNICLSVTAGVQVLEMEATSALPATKAICVALQAMLATQSCRTDKQEHIIRFLITFISSMFLNQMFMILFYLYLKCCFTKYIDFILEQTFLYRNWNWYMKTWFYPTEFTSDFLLVQHHHKQFHMRYQRIFKIGTQHPVMIDTQTVMIQNLWLVSNIHRLTWGENDTMTYWQMSQIKLAQTRSMAMILKLFGTCNFYMFRDHNIEHLFNKKSDANFCSKVSFSSTSWKVNILQKFSSNVKLSSKIIFYLDKLQKVSSGCNYIMNRHFTVLVKFGS